MAHEIVTVYSDDTDGSRAAETVGFMLDGVTYEIDLSASNARELRAALEPFVTHGRRIGGRRSSTITARRAPARIDKEQLDAMRRWARANGYEVSARGPVSPEIREAYHGAR